MSVDYDPAKFIGNINAEEQRAIILEVFNFLDAILVALWKIRDALED